MCLVYRWPPAAAAVLSVIGHQFYVGPLVEAYGFDGAPIALLCAHTSMLTLLLLDLMVRAPHDAATWQGMCRGDSDQPWVTNVVVLA